MSAVLADPQVLPRVVRLSAAVEVNPKIDRTGLTDKTQVSFVPMAAVGAASGHIDVSTVRPYAEVKKGYTNFRNGDVLFAKVTPCMENGKMAVARQLKSGVGFGSTEFHVLRPREGIDSQYIYYFVSSQTFRKEASGHMTGAVGLRRVPSAFLENAEVPLPPLERQREIVAELEKQFSRLDETFANLQRVKANLKRYKASVLKAAVEGRLVETEASIAHREGRTYETGEQLLQRILEERRVEWNGKGKYKEPVQADVETQKQQPGGWAAVSWETVLSPSDGAFKRGPFGSALTKAIFVQQGYKVYEQYCPINDDCSFARYYITPEKFEELNGFAVQAGDYLISCSGVTLGRITRVPEKFDPGVINQALLRVRLNSAVVDHRYFLHLFRGPVFQGQIFEQSAGAAIPNVRGVAELKAMTIPLPPLHEQKRIADEIDRRLSIVREVEAEVDTNLKRAQALRQATLAKAFAGDQ